MSRKVIPANSESTKRKSKIPEYARDFRKEWLCIRGINKDFKYFVDNINKAARGLFQNPRVDRITKFIKEFDLYQKKGKIKDISDKEILEKDVCYIIKIKEHFNNFNQYIKFVKDCYDDDDQAFIDPYPGFKNIYDVFELFCSKFKIKYEEVIVNDDSDFEYENNWTDSDSDGMVIVIVTNNFLIF